MPTNNAINLNSTGIAKYDGAGTFSATTTTNHAVLLGSTSNAINNLVLTNGQLAIGSTGADPSAAGLTPGPGIKITSGVGSITVGAVGTGLAWSVVGASGALVINNAYICTTGAALSFSLPAVSSVGDVVALSLDGSTSWTITQAANQQIRFGTSQTTLGVGGSLSSTAVGDTVIMVCSVANLRWNVVFGSIGNITVV
jgi:hypothetical protein